MTPDDRSTDMARLAVINERLPVAREQVRKRELMAAKARHELTPLETSRAVQGCYERDRIADLRRVLRLLQNGLWHGDAVPLDFAEVAALAGQPGIAHLEEEIAALEAERAELTAKLAAYHECWPSEGVTHPYRYRGPGKHYVTVGDELRRVAPGDVLDLNETQAAAFGDRFEPVEEAEPATATQ